MKPRTAKPGKRLFVFRVTQWIGRQKGSPFKELAIPEDYTLYEFARFILTNFDFDFDFDHAFGFYNHLTQYWEATEAYELFYDDKATRFECPSFVKGVKKTHVNAVFPEPGKKMLFFFDYGDNWKNSASNFWRSNRHSIKNRTRNAGKPWEKYVRSTGMMMNPTIISDLSQWPGKGNLRVFQAGAGHEKTNRTNG